MVCYVLGVDVAASRTGDHFAVAWVAGHRPDAGAAARFELLAVDRQRGMDPTHVVPLVLGELADFAAGIGPRDVLALVIDASGQGRPAGAELSKVLRSDRRRREHGLGRPVLLRQGIITAGHSVGQLAPDDWRHRTSDRWSLPRGLLTEQLVHALRTRSLRLDGLPPEEAEVMRAELTSYVRDTKGRLDHDARGHDDALFAAALALWAAQALTPAAPATSGAGTLRMLARPGPQRALTARQRAPRWALTGSQPPAAPTAQTAVSCVQIKVDGVSCGRPLHAPGASRCAEHRASEGLPPAGVVICGRGRLR